MWMKLISNRPRISQVLMAVGLVCQKKTKNEMKKKKKETKKKKMMMTMMLKSII